MPQELAWWMSQLGIVVEIAGAGYLVYCAFQSKCAVAGLKTNLDCIEHSVESLLREVQGNFNKQRFGFIFLVLGLLMQLAGNGFYP